MAKILSALLILALALPLLSGCGTSYKKGDTTVLMTVGGVKITAEQYRFICMKNATILAGSDKEYFTGEEAGAHLSELEEAVEKELRLYCAVVTLSAKLGVKLSKDDKELIKEELGSLKSQSKSEEAYYEWLEKSFMSENAFYEHTRNYYLERNLFYHVIDEKNGILLLSDEQLLKDIEDHFFAAGQILIKKDSAQPQKTLEKVLTELEQGSDFYAVAEKYSGDTNKSVRYFCTGEMQAYFEETVKGLKLGEVSAPVESDMGVHIIKREPIDSAYVDKHFDAFRDTDLVRLYNELLEEEAEGLEIVYTDAYTGLIRA
jgi:parvulin-like peptidyl-prolyl isomerase